MDQLAHTGEPRSFGHVDGGDQVHLKAGVDIVDVRFAYRRRQMNHALGTSLLKSIDERRQIANVTADHRQVPTRYMPDIIGPGCEIEKGYFIASLDQLFGRMSTNQARPGN